DRLGDGLDAAVAEDLQGGRVTRVVVQGQDGPGGQGELLAELARQLAGQRAVVEGRLGQRGGRVGLAHPRGGERGGQRHAEVHVVQDDLQDGGDDRGPAGRADAEHRLAAAPRGGRAPAGPGVVAARPGG